MDAITNDQILKAITHLRDKNEKKSDLFAGGQRFTLQFCMFKLPVLPADVKNSQLVRVVLPHMLPNVDACLIVTDCKNKGDRTKIDDTIQHYEELLKRAGITEIKEIIPLLKIKLEYQTFESRSALATRYNLLLADASIYRFLPPLLGKAFYGNKRAPIQVNLKEMGLGRRLKQSLRTQICELSFKGANNSIVVGEAEMADEEIVDNIRAAINSLVEVVPGGGDNIYQFSLRFHDSQVLPIYMSSTDRASVPIPALPKQFESVGETLEDQVSTVKGTVTITPDGYVIVTKPDGRKQVIKPGTEPSVPSINVPPSKTRVRKGTRGRRGGAAHRAKVTGKPSERAKKRSDKTRSKPLPSNKANGTPKSQSKVDVVAKPTAASPSASSKKRKPEASAQLSPKQPRRSGALEAADSPVKKADTPVETTAKASPLVKTPAKIKTPAKQATRSAKTPAKLATPAKTLTKQTPPTAVAPTKHATPSKTPAKQATPPAKSAAKKSVKKSNPETPVASSASTKKSQVTRGAGPVGKTPGTGPKVKKMKTPTSEGKLKVAKTPLKTPATSKKLKTPRV